MAISTKKATLGIKKIRGKNKQGKEYEAYQFTCGIYKSPLIFPDDVAKAYLDDFIGEDAHADFKGDDLDDYDND